MRWRRRLAGILLLAMLVGTAACGQKEEETDRSFAVGEEVSNYWFDFTVKQVETAEQWDDYTPAEGKCLVLCTLELENDTKAAVPMGWDDFLLCWDGEQPLSEKTAPLPCRTEEQLPDEFDLLEDETVEGILVYEVPREVKRVALSFLERYNEGESDSRYTEGARYLVWLDLDD